MSELTMSGLIVGIIAILFWTPFLMARGVSKLDERSGAGDMILCAIPILNMARAEKIYYGRFKLCTISPALFAVIVGARVYIWRTMYNNPTIGTISIVLFWLGLAFYLISNMLFVYTVIHDADACQGVKLILLTIAFPFGQYYIGTMLVNVIRHMKEQEATFRK